MRVIRACLSLILLLSVSLVIAQDDPEATETAIPQITLSIWWPDTIARVNERDINSLIYEQSNSFLEQTPNVLIEHRLKAVAQTGGIMSTLRSASNAARDALPTLTLVRRQDLIFAQAAGYLQSMEGFPSLIQGDLNNALQLGQVDDVLYGVPYLLDLSHLVYRPTEDVDYSSWTFDAVLERGEPFVFPAGRANSLNDVLALQYIESGGLSLPNNELILTEPGLSRVFDFYQAATDDELINGSALNHTAATSYLTDFITGDINAAVFNSSRYLALYAEDDSLAMAPIPSETGAATSFLNGWIWVMVTQDAEEQRIALDYLNWLFDAERQSEFAEDILMLPSRESAMTLGLANGVAAEPYLVMIENSLLPLSESEIGLLGREIQTQFSSILTLEQTAEDALNAVINSVGQ